MAQAFQLGHGHLAQPAVEGAGLGVGKYKKHVHRRASFGQLPIELGPDSVSRYVSGMAVTVPEDG